MDDKLPQRVDVIVLGTGLPEAILASACSRSGLTVLHLDRNDYYGAEWSSFNLTSIKEFLEPKESSSKSFSVDDFQHLKTSETEKIVELADREIVCEKEAEWLEKTEFEEQLRNVYRRFSIDILPKVLLSRGDMVQTLCDSQVSQYAEFKLVDRQLCPQRNAETGEITMVRVPCSKGEIFTSPALTMMEKRGLMKFITFCTQWKSQEDKAEGRKLLGEHADKTFDQFLKTMGIDESLRNYIINTIGILDTRPTTYQGMKACCDFMDSVGHFGPSPFLFPLYGCGELSQCFCRLAAVFGSLYCLGRPVQALIYDDNNRICAVIADDQRINCDTVIMSPRYVPKMYKTEKCDSIRRFCYITNKSILEAEKEHISLINIVSLCPNAEISRIVEAGFEVFTAPKGYYLVHATGADDEKLENVLTEIFEKNEIRPIWRLKFDLKSMEFSKNDEFFPENLIVSPNVDAYIHYSSVINQCRQIFCEIWPDRDFLPRSIKKEDEDEEGEEKEENVENS